MLLDRLGLAHLATADPRQLSGGEQRRLAVAAAVVHQPSLVLADEPTVGQDRLTWAAVVGILDAVREAGRPWWWPPTTTPWWPGPMPS